MMYESNLINEGFFTYDQLKQIKELGFIPTKFLPQLNIYYKKADYKHHNSIDIDDSGIKTCQQLTGMWLTTACTYITPYVLNEDGKSLTRPIAVIKTKEGAPKAFAKGMLIGYVDKQSAKNCVYNLYEGKTPINNADMGFFKKMEYLYIRYCEKKRYGMDYSTHNPYKVCQNRVVHTAIEEYTNANGKLQWRYANSYFPDYTANTIYKLKKKKTLNTANFECYTHNGVKVDSSFFNENYKYFVCAFPPASCTPDTSTYINSYIYLWGMGEVKEYIYYSKDQQNELIDEAARNGRPYNWTCEIPDGYYITVKNDKQFANATGRYLFTRNGLLYLEAELIKNSVYCTGNRKFGTTVWAYSNEVPSTVWIRAGNNLLAEEKAVKAYNHSWNLKYFGADVSNDDTTDNNTGESPKNKFPWLTLLIAYLSTK